MDDADSAPETVPANEQRTLPLERTPAGPDSAFRRTADLDRLAAGLFPRFAAGETGLEVEDPAWLGDYRIVGRLGRGGMGVVYAAVDATLDRPVALKVMLPQLAADQDFAARFVREAKAAARVHHPSIVTVYAAGELDGRLYMALEYVEGGTLAEAIRQDGGMGEDRVLSILVECAEGLQAIHRAGLMHRDITPENIFLTGEGHAKIGDLGLARSAKGEDRMTATGVGMGTPAYMAPEQAEGLPDLDIRTDIYALGATLFTMLTGRRPFEGNTPWEVVSKVLCDRPPRPRQFRQDVSRATDELCSKAMSRDRARRHQSPGELRDHARTVSTAVVAPRHRRPRRPPGLPRRAVPVALSLLALGAVAWGVLAWRRLADRREAERSGPSDGAALGRVDPGPARPVLEPPPEETPVERPPAHPPVEPPVERPPEPLPVEPPVERPPEPPPVEPPVEPPPELPPVEPPVERPPEPPPVEPPVERPPDPPPVEPPVGRPPAVPGPPPVGAFKLQLADLVDGRVFYGLSAEAAEGRILWCRRREGRMQLVLTRIDPATGRRHRGGERVLADGTDLPGLAPERVHADPAAGLAVLGTDRGLRALDLVTGVLRPLAAAGTVTALDGPGRRVFLRRPGEEGWEVVALDLATGAERWRILLGDGDWRYPVGAAWDPVAGHLLLATTGAFAVLGDGTVVQANGAGEAPIREAALAGRDVLLWTHAAAEHVSRLGRLTLGQTGVEPLMQLTGSGRQLWVQGLPGTGLALARGRGTWLMDVPGGRPLAALPRWTAGVAGGAVYGWDADQDVFRTEPVPRLTAADPAAVAPALAAAARRRWRHPDTGLTVAFDLDGGLTLTDRQGLTPAGHPWTWARWSLAGEVLRIGPLAADIAWFVLAADGGALLLNGVDSGSGRYLPVAE